MRLARIFALLSRWGSIALSVCLAIFLSSGPAAAEPRTAMPQPSGLLSSPFGLFTALTAAGIQSDEFNTPTLNTSVWTFVDPMGDSSLSMTGSHATIGVPAGTRHDLWTGANEVPALLQSASNDDFEIEARFDSAV